MFGGHSYEFMYFMNSGVLQGCPLSGSMFVVAVNPFLLDLEASLCSPSPTLGAVGACADDIGAVVWRKRAYRRLARVFSWADRLANLHLKATKCKAIPLWAAMTDDVAAALRDILHDANPDWQSFEITDKCIYLGLWIGPFATCDDQWTTPDLKHHIRTVSISQQGAPVETAVKLYNERAFSTLSYVMQLTDTPWALGQRQRHITARLFRTPCSMLATSDVF